ncbi:MULTISPECIES: hypothetical protein [Ponticaulis]|uniref:hypothetical protein n=1 Tax=Ponticaulis TaxID=1123044 RepID=UPI0003B4ACCC|nr:MULTISPECIES: hypothetical protein [Ponticaulis]RPG18551.1 MAG: hypothetical protein CBC85_002200 [Hyphomonadaceae bacterium TMED125]HBH89358.1 hypothetical protein [Hyphomonadaceae bacterium]MAJ09941.1 hypothetical protein [Ponticaulis sp.]MBN05726.1 hypothetical protein [Ponticaulis sp.]MDF1680885.1 hypothetical protein [Ponticaulis sp.]|tara:strand:- start:165 stop:494 length:330 start_codon:yes stop_codon:yes gene_type:complete
MPVVNFCGQSGRSVSFERVSPDSDWAAREGIAMFASHTGFGWRIIRIVELDGRPDNIQPIWAYRDAQRYGARAVFFMEHTRILDRKTTIADLREGLDPVCDTQRASRAA